MIHVEGQVVPEGAIPEVSGTSILGPVPHLAPGTRNSHLESLKSIKFWDFPTEFQAGVGLH